MSKNNYFRDRMIRYKMTTLWAVLIHILLSPFKGSRHFVLFTHKMSFYKSVEREVGKDNITISFYYVMKWFGKTYKCQLTEIKKNE